jgi:hypothetical protein
MLMVDSMQDICGPKICTTGFSSGSGLNSLPSTVSWSFPPLIASEVEVMRGDPG